MADTYLWSQIEPATAILCACLISYKPLFKNINVPSVFTSYFSRRGSGSGKEEEQSGDMERQIPYDGYEAGTFLGKEKERPIVLTRVVT